MTHVPRHVPVNTNQGWGVASLVLTLVAICIVTATVIHKKTYKHPTDPTWRGVGENAPAAPATPETPAAH